VNNPGARAAHLGDFTLTTRTLLITAAALVIGGASAAAAFCLLRLIGLITNAVFYQRRSTSMTAPGAAHHPWWLILLAPAAGGLVVGLMARYGSEKIRGHGMPETIDAIVTGGSKVAPRVALLKPVSAAVSIGTGGPFGAEGPIIMTGGAAGRCSPSACTCRPTSARPCWSRARPAAWRPRSTRRSRRCCSRWSCCSSSGARAA
jgi:H+/Cl- antiporter ClcA